MKTAIILAVSTVSITSFALPTYEPFTETTFVNAIAASGSNAVDLCTGGFSAPSGEKWGSLNWSGTFGTNIHGIDILVTNNPGLFTQSALSGLLPANFPGMPAAGQSITNLLMNPAQPLVAGAASANIIGNSAVLIFSKDINRTNGPSTVYVSYVWSLVGAGQLGGGNDARYLAFVSQSNTVEGAGTSGYYTTWSSMLDQAPGTCNAATESVIAGGSGYYNVASDNTTGKEFTSTPFTAAYNAVQFVVGAVTLTTNKTYTNTIWVNPSVSSFGGPTPPASPIFNDAVTSATLQVNDIGGMIIEDRPGHGANEGGLDSNYMANILVGTTWSYVTGGPEFTLQPANGAIVTNGGDISLTGTAVAAAQSVNYQWQKNGANLGNGAGAAGGNATVSGATTSALTLTGESGGDAGTYTLVATASSTGFALASSNEVLSVTDPDLLTQPQPATANYGGGASFTVKVATSTAGITYAWYNGSTMLVNGLQPDGSTISSAQGTNTGGPFTVNVTMTITNVSCSDDESFHLIVTNASGATAISSSAALSVNDPFIGVEPPAVVETILGGTASIPVTAAGTGAIYQWYNASGPLSNAGDDSDVATPTLTISGAQTNDAGTYYLEVSGSCGPTVTSSNAVVYVDSAAPSSVTVTPPVWTQQTGTHLALLANVTGGTGLIHLDVQRNGTPLTPGQQADGSFVYSSALTNAGLGAIILSNLQVTDSGTYTVIASNLLGVTAASAGSVVTVVPTGQLQLATNHLIVSRVGDGAQPLSGATGNTMYLDQFATNGSYISTIMVPDSGTGAVVVAGAAIAAGNEGAQEAYLTTSSNQQFINFGGFCYNYPYTGGADVTVGAAGNVRGIYAVNGAGIMALVYTNYGLYSGGHGFRDVYSTDGLTNFWTTGSASSVGTVKYVNAGPAGASYTITTPGQGIPALTSGGALAGGVCLGLAGSNLVYAENGGDAAGDSSTTYGLDEFPGVPMASSPASSEILPDGVGHADDFTFSPDLLTVYVADDDFSMSAGGYGGIQRWDNYGTTASPNWNYAYNLSDTTGTGTNGTRGLVAVFPSSITSWGPGVEGAIIYATTSEVVSNRIIEITDNNEAGSASSVLATAGPNQFYRGIRFGPIQVPLGVNVAPGNQVVVTGQSVDLGASTTGNFSYYFPNAAGTAYNFISVPSSTFQWYQNGAPLAGQTGFLLTFPNAQASNAGSYNFVLTSGSIKVSNSAPLVVTVNPFSVSSNLVGWFQLGDGSGTNAADSSIYDDTGALFNFPTNNSEWVRGLGGLTALDFANADSNNDNVVVVPDEAQLDFTNNLEFTLSAWIDSTTNQSSSAALIAKGYGNGGEQYTLDIFGGFYRFFVRNAAATVFEIATTIVPPTNQWQHIAATYDGNAGVMNFYLDGALVASNTAAPNSLLPSPGYPLTIGNRTAANGAPYSLPFVGLIQDVRLYDAAFGPQDIQAIYASQNLAASAFPPSAATNAPPVFVASGQFQLTFSGVPASTFHLWSTTNLALKPITSTWTLVTTGAFNSNGIATYIDTTATGPAKYYTITQP